MNFTRCFAALLLLTLGAGAADGDAFKKVAGARFFAFGGIGYAGITSEEEIAFREILASNTAQANFLRLLKSGNIQARCYALVGLRLKDLPAFEGQAGTFLSSRTEVETVTGCMVMKQPMSAVVTAIRAGNYDQQAQRELKH